MTDLLVRGEAAPLLPDAPIAPEFALGTGARWTIAALATGAGVIHLAMVPSHWSGSAWEGLAFAVCGWLQLALAVLVFVRPTRALLWAGVALNAVAIGAWAVSRTVGLPLSAHSGAEDAGFVDITTVVFEALLVVALLVFLFAPRARASRGNVSLVGSAIVLLAVLALTTGALASPGAADHAHSHADNVIGGGHDHGLPAGVTAGNDKGFSLLHNGQHEHTTMVHQLDQPTQALLDHQIAVTRRVAAKTPTVTDAIKAGYMRVGPYFPGIGAHYMKKIGPDGSGFTPLTMNLDGLIDDTDLNNPLMLIFDGTNPTSKIAGFMYYSFAPTEPAGFAGRNDTWHLHQNLCLKFTKDAIDVPYGLDNSASEAECKAAGAMMIKLSNYMVHVWSVPGYEMPDGYGGVFGEENPKLTCADGTYYMLPKAEWVSHPLNACKAQ